MHVLAFNVWNHLMDSECECMSRLGQAANMTVEDARRAAAGYKLARLTLEYQWDESNVRF